MERNMNPCDLEAFEIYLVQAGYSELTIPGYLRKVKAFLTFCDMIGVDVDKMDCIELKEVIENYCGQLTLSSQTWLIKAAVHAYYGFCSGKLFHKRLRIKDFECIPAISNEIERFRKYLREVAGLRVNTITSHCNTVAIFLCYCFENREFSPDKITINQVQAYLIQGLSHVSAPSKKTILTRIRSYLRFLEFEDGSHSDELLRLPLTSPVWKQAGLPKYLTENELSRLFATYNRTKPNGIRDYAIARCMKDFGLRCSEVASLSLDNFDWIQGTLIIRNAKNHYDRKLPLKKITGDSIAEYLLHSRPLTCERTLFVRSGKERGYPMGTSQVGRTVRYAAMKANLENFNGTHMLRYTTVREMLDNGTDFKIIADILGHECLETTKIYTKLDLNQLREVAGAWPEAKK